MKTTDKFLAFVLVAVAMIFASCSKDDDCAQIVADNFSRDIIGMWEGVEMTGDETNGNADARIAYFADGTYIYYRKLADVWFPRCDETSKYSIEGSKLTTQWKSKEAENYSSEWWDINAIKDGEMKWSALRERKDGSQYTATFTWKKVDDTLTSEQILAKLSGTWTDVDLTYISFLKGEITDTKIVPGDPQVSTTFASDGKCWFSLPNPKDPTKKVSTEYTYTLKGNVLALVTEKREIDDEEHELATSSIRVVNSISDDQIILVQYDEIDEELVDLLGSDAVLILIRTKRN